MTAFSSRLIDRKPKINFSQLASRCDSRSLLIIEWQTEFTRENVRRTARNNRESCIRSGQSLDCFVDSSVTACDYHVGTPVARSTSSDLGCIAGTILQFHVTCDTERFEL